MLERRGRIRKIAAIFLIGALVLPATPLLWHRGSWDQRPSLADYVTMTGAARGAIAAGGC